MLKKFLKWLVVASVILVPMQAQETIQIGGYEAHPSRIIVKPKAGREAEEALMRRALPGMNLRKRLPRSRGLLVLENAQITRGMTPEEKAARLKARMIALAGSGLYEYVQPDYHVQPRRTPTDAAFVDGRLWGLNNAGQSGGVPGADINAPRAWDLSIGSTNIIVAVIDTGVRYTHRDLAPQMWRNPREIPNNGLDDDANGYVDDVVGINAINGTGDPVDDVGHGTHVAGTIGAAANDVNPHVGVAWSVQLMACKFLDNNGGFNSDAIECIDFAVAHGAKILNNSWGGGPFDQALFDSISAARAKGVLFVAASGNSASDNDQFPDSPSGYQLDNIISVAAIDRFDQLAIFSNFGRTNVHVGAPGVEIFSTWNTSDTAYSNSDGTSMACPHVAGVAALLLAQSPNRTYSQIRQKILKSVRPTPALAGKVSTGGRVDAYNALQGQPDGILEVSVTPPPLAIFATGTNITMFVSVSDDTDVPNATVVGTIAGTSTIISFANDGIAPDTLALDGVYSGILKVPSFPGLFTVSLSVSAPNKTSYTTNIIYEAVQRPVNDNFANAAKIPAQGGIVVGDNRLASMETLSGEKNHAGATNAAASLWWVWSPAASGRVIVDPAGSTFDTVVAVHTGSTLANLREIASTNDVGMKRAGYLFFNAQAGTTYWIAVAGINPNETGHVQLRVEPDGAPDVKPPIVTINRPLSGSLLVSTNGRIIISGTAFDPSPNSSGVRQVIVQINSDPPVTAAGTVSWITTNLLSVGQNTIKAVAQDNAENVSAPVTVTVTYRLPATPNDYFALATLLTGSSGTAQANNSTATKEVNEGYHGGNQGGHSLWWKWIAPADGLFFATTLGSSFDTLLSLYTGDSLANATRLADNDNPTGGPDEVSHGVIKGQAYYIAVDGFAGAVGDITLQYNFSASAVFTVTTSSAGHGTTTPRNESFPMLSTVSLVATPDADYQFESWRTPAGTVVSRSNPYDISLVGSTNLVAYFTARQYTEDFETGGFGRLPWQSSGWVVQGSAVGQGARAASSGFTSDGQTKTLTLRMNFDAGVGSFRYRVSSEELYDVFSFRLNGRELLKASGVVDWTTFTFDLPAGESTLVWVYQKDGALNAGLDAAFIDQIQLPSRTTEIRVSTPLAGAPLQITVQGQVNSTYTLQRSTDLRFWVDITTSSTDSAGNLTFSGINTGGRAGFYRVVRR